MLSAKERVIHEYGLVSVLRQIHDELDAAVLDAYGWSDLLPLLRVAHGNDAPGEGQTRDDAKRSFDDAVLERLVALNAERAAEEARGVVRWLRPEFQNPQAAPTQTTLDTGQDDDAPEEAGPVVMAKQQPWPKDAVAQVRAVAYRWTRSQPVSAVVDRGRNACRNCSTCWKQWAARITSAINSARSPQAITDPLRDV